MPEFKKINLDELEEVDTSKYRPRNPNYGGGAKGEFEVKQPCGKRHAWCKLCRPDHPQEIRKKEKELAAGAKEIKSCRNCGVCDDCLGLIAPDGYKICRECKDVLTIDSFPGRGNGKIRNICKICYSIKNNGDTIAYRKCTECGRKFTYKKKSNYDKCNNCRNILKLICPNCSKEFIASGRNRKYCSHECYVDNRNKINVARDRENKNIVIMHYGNNNPSCNCCGNPDATLLELDHINGGGHRHRKELNGDYWGWIIKNEFPNIYQLLCKNCNGAKRDKEYCPAKNTTCAELRKFWSTR